VKLSIHDAEEVGGSQHLVLDLPDDAVITVQDALKRESFSGGNVDVSITALRNEPPNDDYEGVGDVHIPPGGVSDAELHRLRETAAAAERQRDLQQD
jgi:hypothetical protein